LLFDAAQARTLLTISSSWVLGQLFTAAVFLKGAIFLLESYPKSRWALLKQTSLDTGIGIFSIVTYAWLNPLILLGSRKNLDVSDLYDLDPDLASKDLDPKFWAAWNEASSWRKKSRLIVALVGVMKWQILAPIPPRLAKIGFDFCQPLLIEAIQSHLSKPLTTESAREGRALIGATVLIYIGKAVSMGIYQYYNQRASILLRGHLLAGIYRKTMTLNVSSKDNNASVTLLSNDVEWIEEDFRSLHEFWVGLY
jgi:ATP-binding cassette, subfamily C (CFTR/MRP), member 1